MKIQNLLAIALLLAVPCVATSQDFLSDPEPTENLFSNISAAGDNGKLFGLIAPSDHCFSDFISPMTNPVYFEDPRTLTEARAIFLNHHVPTAAGGGNVQVYAMQLRAALTENLSIIATKDGFGISQNPVVNDGFADVMAGLKYNLYKNAETQTILSVGTTYEIPMGSRQMLQGNVGEFHLFATAGQQIGDNWHVISGSGFRLPDNTNKGNQMWYWSNHLDRRLGNGPFYLFTEANWYHYMSSGSAFGLPIGGGDLFNLGSVGVAGQDMVTGAYGVKYKPSRNMEIGLAYEIPYTSRRDLLQDRLTADLILRF